MNFNKLFLSIVLVLALFASSAFADASVAVNQDASATKAVVCSVLQPNANEAYIYKWKDNNVPQPQFDNQFEIDPASLTRGETWTCTVQTMEYDSFTYSYAVWNVGSDSTVIKNSAPVFTSVPVTTVAAGLYVYDANANDADGDTLTYSATGPVWLSINPATGILSGTAVAGVYPITVSVTDGQATTTQSYILTVGGGSNAAPVFTSTPITTGTVGVGYSYTAVATDTDPLTYSMTTFPIGMSITTAGVISWTPTATGTYPVVVSVTDGINAPVTQSFSIVVGTIVPPSPSFSTTSCPDGTAKKSYTCDINAAGTGPLQYSLVSHPSGMTINSTTGVISWKPSTDGTFTFIVRVTDLSTSLYSDKTYQITITSNKPQADDLFVDSIDLESDTVLPGDTMKALVTLEDTGKVDFNDLQITLTIDDLNLQSTTDKFNLNNGEKKTIYATLDIPTDATKGVYQVKVTIKNNDVTITKFRTLSVTDEQQVTPVVVPTTPVEVNSVPSITSSLPPAQESRLNWFGIVFMILLALLLLALVVYLIKKARDQVSEQPDDAMSIVSLDRDSFY